jgi:hypothetical protein
VAVRCVAAWVSRRTCCDQRVVARRTAQTARGTGRMLWRGSCEQSSRHAAQFAAAAMCAAAVAEARERPLGAVQFRERGRMRAFARSRLRAIRRRWTQQGRGASRGLTEGGAGGCCCCCGRAAVAASLLQRKRLRSAHACGALLCVGARMRQGLSPVAGCLPPLRGAHRVLMGIGGAAPQACSAGATVPRGVALVRSGWCAGRRSGCCAGRRNGGLWRRKRCSAVMQRGCRDGPGSW